MSTNPIITPLNKKKLSNRETNLLTREAICTALILLMKETSFHKISITDIVKRAGVSRTAYYSNYSSKQDILIDLVHLLIDDINQQLLPYSDSQTGKAKDIDSFIRVLFEVIHEKKDIYQTLLSANFNYLILDCLNDTMLSQLKNPTEEMMYRIYFNAGAIYNVFTRWIQSSSPKTTEEMIGICTTIYYTPMSER